MKKIGAKRCSFLSEAISKPMAVVEPLEARALFSTLTWTGGGADNHWGTAGNWAGGVAPVSGDSLIFSGSTQTFTTDNYAAGTSFGSIEFASTGFVLSGKKASVSGGITVDSSVSSATISQPIVLAASQSINVSSSETLTVAGAVTGSGLLTKTGAGILALSVSNAYTGGTTISAGAVLAEDSGALGTGTVTVSSGGASTASLQLEGGITISNTFAAMNSETVGDTPTIESISGNNTISSTLTMNGSTGNGILLQSDAGTFTLSGELTTTLYTVRSFYLQGAGNGVVSGNITDDSYGVLALVKNGTGSWTLTGSNNYQCGTTVNAGTLTASGTAVAGTVVTNPGGTFNNPGIAGAPWTDTDIAGPTLSGVGTFYSTNNYKVTGSGSDITGAADQLNYLCQPFTGDGGITAEVNGAPVNSDGSSTTGSKDGVMFRDNTLSDSSFVEVGYTNGTGIQMLYREGNGATVQVGGTVSSVTGAVWLQLNRVQGAYTASYSTNGTTFYTVGTITTDDIEESAFVGMDICSHTNSLLASATFSNVAINSALAVSPTSVDLTFTVPWLGTSNTLVYIDDAGTYTLVANVTYGTSSVVLTGLPSDQNFTIELASARAVKGAGGTLTGNTPPALSAANATVNPTSTNINAYQVTADASLSEGIAANTDSGTVTVAHEYVYASGALEAVQLAGISVSSFSSSGTGGTTHSFSAELTTAGNTGGTAPNYEESLASLLGISGSTPILAVEDGSDGDFNDAYANISVTAL